MFLTVFFIAGVLAIAAYAFRASLAQALGWLRSKASHKPGTAPTQPTVPPTAPPNPPRTDTGD